MPITSFRRRAAVAGACLAAIAAFGAGPVSAQKVNIKVGHPLSPKTTLHQWAEVFKAGVEKRASDKAKVTIYPASQLGAIPRMVEGAQLGTIEIIEVPPAFLSGLDPRFSVVAAPGVFKSIEHADRVVHDPEFKKVFWTLGDRKGLKQIGFSCETPGDYASVKPIRKIADFHGLKLRVFGSPLEIEELRRVGATGVPMPLSEVIGAIQQRTIDGNRAGISVFVPFKYWTVAKHIIRPHSSVICVGKFASKAWFDKQPDSLRTIVAEEAANADKVMLPRAVKQIEALYKVWVKQGGELNDLSKEEQAELDRRLSTVGEEVLKDKAGALEVYTIMKAVAKRRLNS